jgi:hypothetical protein
MFDNSSFTSTRTLFQALISTNIVLHLVTNEAIDFHGQSRLTRTSQNLSNIVITSVVDPDSLNPDADTDPDPSESGSVSGSGGPSSILGSTPYGGPAMFTSVLCLQL